jgi:L-histidine N-alpha-methyltransferase
MRHSGASTTDLKQTLPVDVLAGLRRRGQKELPAYFLYDALGSALFEAITLLPEYGLTRADFRLIEAHAKEIREHGRPTLVIELGSGGGGKARGILEVLAHQSPIQYCPVDVSPAALEQCRLAFLGVPQVEVQPIEASYDEGLRYCLDSRAEGQSALVLFFGSSIGNFTPNEARDLFSKVRGRLMRGDLFLFSADLEKDEARMLAAYHDPIGVTGAFNLNVLARLNREKGATFDVSRFEHVVRYNQEHHRIEMHLRSLVDQVVAVAEGPPITFRKGETIRTECSYKYRLNDVRKLCESTGFHVETQWIDWEWPLAQTLLRVV